MDKMYFVWMSFCILELATRCAITRGHEVGKSYTHYRYFVDSGLFTVSDTLGHVLSIWQWPGVSEELKDDLSAVNNYQELPASLKTGKVNPLFSATEWLWLAQSQVEKTGKREKIMYIWMSYLLPRNGSVQLLASSEFGGVFSRWSRGLCFLTRGEECRHALPGMLAGYNSSHPLM